MARRKRSPELSNIRQLIGWIVGCKVVDVTAGDPSDFPDFDFEDSGHIVLMFDNGGTLTFDVSEQGFWHSGDPAKETAKRIARLKRQREKKQQKQANRKRGK